MKNSNRTRVLPACSAVRHTTATPRAPTASLKGIYIYVYLYIHVFFPVALRPNADHGLLILGVSRSHTATHHSR